MPTYFAEVINGKVQRVIVADQSFIDSGKVGDPKNWIETFMDGSVRKNYAGIGYEYHKDIDAFVAPKQFSSWVLDKNDGEYKAPKAPPNDGKRHLWNEDRQDWSSK